MLYRKAAPTPPRLLLRIAATAGAGALLGAAACSSVGEPHGLVPMPNGLVANPPADAADQGDSEGTPIMTGVLPNPNPGPCGGGPCGTIALPAADAGDAGETAPDAVSDAEIAPDDVAHCGGVCGVIVHLDQ
jgi:hypothetical protein